MASNFKISAHRNDENLHFKLSGDFDAGSAHELINSFKTYSPHASKIFIHTNCLKHIDLIGREVFQQNINLLNTYTTQIIITGKKAVELAPETNRSIMLTK